MDEKESNYICGVEFFRLPNRASLDVEYYFECIAALKPLFESDTFKAAILRFYIYYIIVPDDNGVCLSLVYDTTDPVKVQAIIGEFVEKNVDRVIIFESSW